MDLGQERIALVRRWLLLAAYLLAVVLAALYWSTDTLSRSSNRVANELVQNGLSSFVRAATPQRDRLLRELSQRRCARELCCLIAHELAHGGGRFTHLDRRAPRSRFSGAPRRARPA